MRARGSCRVVGDPPPQDGKQPSADYQVVSASYFQAVDLPVVVRPRLRRARPPRRRPGLHRQRGLRPRAPAGALADWHARLAACGPGGEGGGARDRRRRAAGQGTPRRDRGLRAGLRADGAGPAGRHVPGRPSRCRERERAGAVGARRDRAGGQAAAGERAKRDDPRGRGVGSHRPPPLPRGARHGVRRSGAGAGDGRAIRHPRLLGAAADSRPRRAPGARRDDGRRRAVGGRRRGAGARDRRSAWAWRSRSRSGACWRACCSACSRWIR